MHQVQRSPSSDIAPQTRQLRAALYLRVSTGRQAEGDVSIPSQRDLTTRHCQSNGWAVVDEYVEPGASATDDRRPVFQVMLERACGPDQPYDLIIVHSYSRFFRDGATMELTIRKLRKHGVDVISMTQPTGADPAQEMMRQIIGIFDEYTSKENGKNVSRAMKENARQGFWNGASPPLGFKIIEAERRGQKIKKRLNIDPVEAEAVRLIFRLYLEGDTVTGTPPCGIKAIASWLNKHGHRTKKGGTFGIGPVHHILTNPAYVGRWRYNVRSSKTGEKRPASEIVEISVPAIIDQTVFDQVQARLAANNPKMVAPRIVSSPILLTGLATCAHCGGGMTQRTGTSSTGRVYAYYTCATKAQKGPSVCKGNTIPMAFLDDLVITALKEKLFTPHRMVELLSALVERRAVRNSAVDQRLLSLQAQLAEIEAKLTRLYRSIEDGIVEIDDLLSARITALKAEREMTKAALDRAKAQNAPSAIIDSEKIVAFTKLMTDLLNDGGTQARKAYLRSLISTVVVGENNVKILGNREALHSAVSGTKSPLQNVRGFVPKWRTQHDSNVRPLPSEGNALSS